MKHSTAHREALVFRKEKPINKNPTIHKQIKIKRNKKMAKSKHRINKMIFQTQDRKHIPLSEEHKYILMNHREPLPIGSKQNEILPRATRRTIRPQHI